MYELNHSIKSRVERLHIVWKLRRQRERPKPKREREKVSDKYNHKLTLPGPVERIVRAFTGVRNQNQAFASCLLCKIMGTEIRHNFRPWKDLDMEFRFQLPAIGVIMDVQSMSVDHLDCFE